MSLANVRIGPIEARIEPEDVAACHDAGMDVVLTKPFPLAELERALLKAIDLAGDESAPLGG